MVDSHEFKSMREGEEVSDRLRLFMFFQTLKDARIVTGIGSAFNGSLVRRLVERQDLKPESGFKENPARNLSFSNYGNFRPNVRLIEANIEELPKVEIPDEHLDYVKGAFEHHLDRAFDTAPGADFAMFRNKDAIERKGPRNEVRLDGDYLLFRVEQRRTDSGSAPARRMRNVARISINFVRFFPHKDDGTRFMMLSLASYQHQGDNRFLAARGWVDNLGDQLLATGRIVSRKGDTIDREVDHGGMSTLVVEATRTSPFVVYRDIPKEGRHVVEAAACLHLRALYGQKPSLSRGYLVRCIGVERYGGRERQPASERYKAIRALHAALGDWNHADHAPEDAAQRLHEATGFPADAFYRVSKTGMPHGLLVNLPFAREDDNTPVNMPLMLPGEDAPVWAEHSPARRLADDEVCAIPIELDPPPTTA